MKRLWSDRELVRPQLELMLEWQQLGWQHLVRWEQLEWWELDRFLL